MRTRACTRWSIWGPGGKKRRACPCRWEATQFAATWVRTGAEYNKGSYYRVYGTTLHYSVGGQARSIAIASMISWRGQWYVVHLASIR